MQGNTRGFEARGGEAVRGSNSCRPKLVTSAEQTESWLENCEELKGLCRPHAYAYAKGLSPKSLSSLARSGFTCQMHNWLYRSGRGTFNWYSIHQGYLAISFRPVCSKHHP